ncbi:hypothetical protein POVCU2_0024670 [Plasmodium ovale curtisi]|uniref:Uncharacterized protein n=1 Tax=Plasmodium ovale curtisi TaxID=864141 RepID=A0A1A8VUC6_PLAOA|nr:hypothetical protein POVCU2_0024670 [Plasmodium ovale curtisi]
MLYSEKEKKDRKDFTQTRGSFPPQRRRNGIARVFACCKPVANSLQVQQYPPQVVPIMWRLLLVYVSWCFPYCVLCPFHFCNYGEYFKNGACYGCEENSYSSYTNSEGCFGCPPSSSNNIRSSKFIYDCACDNDDYYLNYLGNRCDMCSDVSHRFFCGKNLNELHVDNIESFFKHKNEITFANFDRCLIKKDRKNMYPIMSNMFIYCKSPDICLDTCGRCSEYNEGFMCDRCTKQYAKNIFLKYAKCKRCYHVIFTIFTTLLYCFVVLILFILLVKCINVSLLSNDLTESERENYTAQERGNTEAAHQLQSGDIRTHYFLNIYLHNVFFDLIKSIQLNFIHFIKLDCLHLDISVSKVVATQTFVFAFGLCLLLCFTLLCNLVFLYLRRGNAGLFGLPPNGNSLYRGITTADAEVTSGSANSVIGVGEPNRVSEWEERLRDKLSHPPLPLRLPLLLPPLLLPNFTRPSYVKVTFFYASEAVEFLKTWIQICYYQYIQIFLYVTNSLVIFIFLSSYVCIGLFNYKRSYYDTSALCSDNSNVGVSKYEKLRGLSAGKEGDSSEGTPQDRYYFYHYLKCKMNIVTRPIDEVERDISLLEDMEEVEPVRRMPGGDAEYIRQQCVLISPFVAETVIQLLFISKNINHMIRYIEIQRTPIDRFLTKAIYIYKEVFKGNYKLFRTEMTRIFADIVRDVRCFKDVRKEKEEVKTGTNGEPKQRNDAVAVITKG